MPPTRLCTPVATVLLLIGAVRAQDSKLDVDLSGGEVDSIDAQDHAELRADADSTESRDWFRRFEMWGYVATDYIHTGSEGIRPRGAAVLRQASLFVRAEVQEKVSFFLELRGPRFPSNNNDMSAHEVYAQFHDIVALEADDFVSLKVGRVDIPFGQYYLQEDAVDNALITYPVALPYGIDEGVVAYGQYRGIDWAAAFLEGNYSGSDQQGSAKCGVLRVSGKPSDTWTFTASGLASGGSPASALCFSGATLSPVGARGSSSLGNSPTSRVEVAAYVLDAQWKSDAHGSVQLSAGQAFVRDDVSQFNREIIWASFEPMIRLSEDVQCIFRWSEVGTFDSDKGYLFRALPTSDGAASFGYDTKRAQRLSLGARWAISPRVTLKAEIGRDRYWTIDASSASPGRDRREFAALELVLSF